MRVIVIGAGPAGLATAVAVQRLGFTVSVHERVVASPSAGTGLTLWPNAVRALDALGLAQAVLAVAEPCDGTMIQASDGTVLSHMSGAVLTARYGTGGVTLHRADLIAALRSGLPADVVHAGDRCTGYRVADAGVAAGFDADRWEHGDLLVGADGARSTVRGHLTGRADDLNRAPYKVFRGVADVATTGRPGTLTLGRGAQFGAFPMSRGRTYWFAAVPTGVHIGQLTDHFAGWPKPIPALLRATAAEQTVCTGIADRAPLRRWHSGPVVLVGDAAHPSTPNLGQGASQAFEDAVALGTVLADGTLADALDRYTRARSRRAATVTRQAHWMGVVGQWRHPVACAVRDQLIRRVPDAWQARRLDLVFGASAGARAR